MSDPYILGKVDMLAEIGRLRAENERLRAFAQRVVDTLTAAKRAANEGK